MNDLENLWEHYPTPEPPTDALLREGRRRARARRRALAVRPLLAAATTAAVVSAFVVGNHTGDRTGGRPSYAGPVLQASAFRADLHPATSCAALLADYRARGLKQVGPYGWENDASPFAAVPAAGVVRRGLDEVGNSATGTNVQEAGVDEPDDVKTDGSLIVRVQGAVLSVYDASGSAVRRTAQLRLPRLSDAQILLAGHTVVAIGTAAGTGTEPGSRVETISVADAASPRLVSDVAYSGSVSSIRQHGEVIRMVIESGPPALAFVQPHQGLSMREARERNRQLVRSSTLTDWLPTYDNGSGSRALLDCGNVALPPKGLPLGTVSIVGFDAATPTAVDAIGVAGQTGTAYESADHLYLTSTPSPFRCPCPLVVRGGVAMAAHRTTIFAFDLDGPRAVHVATGHVRGTIADRWSMDEAGGVLRVATTSAEQRGRSRTQSSAVVALRAEGTRLVEIGRLDGLGVDETLTAARWSDDVAILSTARHTDPLFSVDLSDPTHPRLLGALHIPGYTTYFHPIADGKLIGVGQKVAFDQRGERERAEVALFDISDLADARRLAVAPLGQWTWPLAGEDPRAFTWLPDRSTALTTFRTRTGALVLGVYRVEGDRLVASLRRLPATARSLGGDLSPRTFELTDGRVVLVVGDRLQFLDL
ncbi:MAG: beta-propeller domain-containing protein [Marmoricola sp.]